MRSKKESGISLIALLIAVAIAGIAAYFLAPLATNLSRSQSTQAAKAEATKLNTILADEIKRSFKVRLTDVSGDGIALNAATPFYLRLRNIDPAQIAATRELLYTTVCQPTSGTTLAPIVGLNQVEQYFCAGLQAPTGCGPGNRLAIRLTRDPNITVANNEVATDITPALNTYGTTTGGDRRVLAQALCARTAATITGIQAVPLNADVRVQIASAYLSGKDKVRWEISDIVLPVRSRDVSNIDFLDSK